MSTHAMPFGATLLGEGGTRFRLWAPAANEVELVLDGGKPRRVRMQRLGKGWHETTVDDAGPGTRYRYDVGQGFLVPDPASRSNPDDVHGVSVVVDPEAYLWRDDAWRGRPWHEAVVYELHVGCFTDEGTFAAAAQRLPELAALGITVVELMPVADFRGRRGWGYDGVLPYAPDASYGTPDDLKAFVDQAHALGLAVLLDVVYNHFGPEGNYLHAYCPSFFNEAHRTPWGAAINFDGLHNETVREFFLHNALYWVEEFHFDGLRLDAVHAIHDSSPLHIAAEIGAVLRSGPGAKRHVHLVVENDANRASLLERDSAGLALFATAQWNDDLHHAAHVLLTGEREGYYRDYADAPANRLARALGQGYVYQGQPSAFRGGVPHGEPSGHLPPEAFVSFLQNHDQIGNRAFGERISALAPEPLLEAAYACLLLSPHVPLLFMGEEYAASTPFLYFCDFAPKLARAVAEGRRKEFEQIAMAHGRRGPSIPDPNEISAFMACKLRWRERETGQHVKRLDHVRQLLALRHEHLVPRMAQPQTGGRYHLTGGLLRVSWPLEKGARWHLAVNFGQRAALGDLPPGQVVYTCRVDAGTWSAGAVCVTFEEGGATHG